MNLTQLRAEVQAVMDEDTGSSAVFWQEDDIDAAINDALDEISDATGWYETRVPLPLLRGTVYYDLFAHCSPAFASLEAAGAEDGFISVAAVWNPVTSAWLTGSSIDMLDACSRWERNEGQPERYVIRGCRWLGLSPVPATSGEYLDLWLTASPPHLLEESDIPGFPEEYHYGLVELARCELFAQDHEAAKAMKYWERYMAYESKLRHFVENRLERSRTFIAGGAHA